MTESEIYSGLIDVFHETFRGESLTLTPQTSAAHLKGWDSIKMINLILGVERHFDIRLHSREVDKLRTVVDFAELVKRKTTA